MSQQNEVTMQGGQPSLPKHAATTKSGQDWLTLALDPFHDTGVPISGLPDRTNIPTACQFIKRHLTITAPGGIGSNQWDCHIFSLPLLSSMIARASGGDKVYEDCTPASGSENYSVGNINVVKMKSGNPTYVQDSFTAFDDADTTCLGYSPTDGNKKSQIRLIGGGFEVHNDTADLYKNGNVVTYSSSNDWSESSLAVIGDGAGSDGIGLVKKARYPPVFPTDAALYTDARTWSARDGCYVPLRLDLDCPATKFRPRTQSIPVFQDKEDGSADATTGKMIVTHKYQNAFVYNPAAGSYIQFGVANGDSAGETESNGWVEAPIETTGAFFSGLSPETVLTLDIRWLCEVAPTSANPAMLSMCSRSAPYDPRALECYTNCLLSLPPGVPVGMNEKGDFWRMAVRTAKTALAITAPLVPTLGPAGKAAFLAAEAGLSIADVVAAKKKTNKSAAKPKAAAQKPRAAKLVGGANNTFRK